MNQQSFSVSGTILVTDHDQNITGARDGNNWTFSTSGNFVPGTTRVYLNGLRQTPDKNELQTRYDYYESAANSITFHFGIQATDLLIIEYQALK